MWAEEHVHVRVILLGDVPHSEGLDGIPRTLGAGQHRHAQGGVRVDLGSCCCLASEEGLVGTLIRTPVDQDVRCNLHRGVDVVGCM